MWLFVGLGNHGAEYAGNRHNVGYMLIDRMSGSATMRRKFQGLIGEVSLARNKIILLKPETYMNNSGQSVSKAAQYYKILPEKVVVFHDELDIAPNAVRVKLGGGNAGHNGLKSVQAHLGTADFWRVRIGIGRPQQPGADVSNYVLSNFSKTEMKWVSPLLERMADDAALIVKGDLKEYEKSVQNWIKEQNNGV